MFPLSCLDVLFLNDSSCHFSCISKNTLHIVVADNQFSGIHNQGGVERCLDWRTIQDSRSACYCKGISDSWRCFPEPHSRYLKTRFSPAASVLEGNPCHWLSLCTCRRRCGPHHTALWVAPCISCTQDTSVPSTDLRREHVAYLPYLEHKCHMFRHVVNVILTSSMVITKLLWYIVGFGGKRPVAVSSSVLFSYKSSALSNWDLSQCCSNPFSFISYVFLYKIT